MWKRFYAIVAVLATATLLLAASASARAIRDYHPQFGYCGPAVTDDYRLDNEWRLWQCIYLYNWMGNDYYQWWLIPN